MFRIPSRPALGHGDERWTGGAVLALCAAHPAIPSLAVVEGPGEVIGLIERERLYSSSRSRSGSPSIPQADRSAGDARGDDRRWRDADRRVKEPIACRFPQAISSGFAIVERGRYLGIGPMTALPEKTVDLAHRRAIELEEAHRKAASASEATSRFLATMSHALRTPLNTIIGFAELMLMRDVEQMTAGPARLHHRHPESRRAPAGAHQRHP